MSGPFTPEERREIVLALLSARVPMADLCREHQVTSPTIYGWRDRVRYDPATETVVCPAGHRMTPAAPFVVQRRQGLEGRSRGSTARPRGPCVPIT